MTQFFHPRLLDVEALAPYRLRTRWSTGETLEVDVSAALARSRVLAPIRVPAVFARVRVSGWCQAVEWFDAEFGADNVYAWAKEQSGGVSHQMFDTWMHRNALSLSTAAEALGISRRMVSYYRTGQKTIPRSIWLACLGWEATRPASDVVPRRLPSAKEYALAHA